MRKKMTATEKDAALRSFNDEYPVGTRVRVWPGLKEGAGNPGVIWHPATILGEHTPVAWVSPGGCFALTHVEKDRGEPS